MRWLGGVLLFAAALAGGCAGWSQTPYNPRQACDIVGGVLTPTGDAWPAICSRPRAAPG